LRKGGGGEGEVRIEGEGGVDRDYGGRVGGMGVIGRVVWGSGWAGEWRREGESVWGGGVRGGGGG